MKAIIKKNPQEPFCVVDLPEPQIKDPLSVKLQMLYSGICGTDLHINDWDKWAAKNIILPHINGHEGVGKIVALGKNVTNFQIGDIVAFESHIFDNLCRTCQNDGRNVCENMKILGVSTDGVWQEKVLVPARILFKLDKKVPYQYASILEPFANAYHTQSLSKITGKNVLVMGDGPIGIFAALIALTRQPANLFIVGINPYRAQIIRDLNLNYLNFDQTALEQELKKQTKNEGIDVILEFSGSTKALKSAINIINPLGDINVLSIYSENVSLDINQLTFKNVRLQTVLGRKIWQTWKDSYELFKTQKINWSQIKKIITHQIPFTEVNKGIDLIRSQKALKVQLTFPEALIKNRI